MDYRHTDTYNGTKILGTLENRIGLERGGGSKYNTEQIFKNTVNIEFTIEESFSTKVPSHVANAGKNYGLI